MPFTWKIFVCCFFTLTCLASCYLKKDKALLNVWSDCVEDYEIIDIEGVWTNRYIVNELNLDFYLKNNSYLLTTSNNIRIIQHPRFMESMRPPLNCNFESFMELTNSMTKKLDARQIFLLDAVEQKSDCVRSKNIFHHLADSDKLPIVSFNIRGKAYLVKEMKDKNKKFQPACGDRLFPPYLILLRNDSIFPLNDKQIKDFDYIKWPSDKIPVIEC